jgi:hypothetical protein
VNKVKYANTKTAFFEKKVKIYLIRYMAEINIKKTRKGLLIPNIPN